ncbi:MAG: molybdate ABC transporter substrate-binding protein [Deltaproteobacteria bacterium]|nr:molybdate ABC transporter substrate-binding protein [Deltaproteobacteria bacterium]
MSVRICIICMCALIFGVGNVVAEENQEPAPPVITAAADTKYALEEIATAFTRETGKSVKLSFGSSGNAYRQLQQGAPFEMFLSADENYALDLADKGMTLDRGTLYAVGRIVIMVPPDSPLKPDAELTDLRAALAEGRLQKFAIPNPEHAPYGRAAKEALQKAGLWEMIEPKLVLGEDATQATQFALKGSTQGGILPFSFSSAPAIAKLGKAVLIPADWHNPLRQRMILMKNAGPVTKAFYAYLQQPEARSVLVRYGFVLPEEKGN